MQPIQNLKENPVKQFPKNRTRYRIIEDRKKKIRQIELAHIRTTTTTNTTTTISSIENKAYDGEKSRVVNIVSEKNRYLKRNL